MIKLILTDIEGTTSSIDFVHKVLFPYARQHMGRFLNQFHKDPDVKDLLGRIGSPPLDLLLLEKTLNQWIDEDRKHPVLKAIQGMIWKQAYQDRRIVAHVYPDVPACLRAWKKAGLGLAVYSSGSIEAQKLLFAHSDQGELSALFQAFFDTSSGPKREGDSYRHIAAALGCESSQILFLSDIPEELDAAALAGMKTCQLLREPGMTAGEHPAAKDFLGVDALLKREAKI